MSRFGQARQSGTEVPRGLKSTPQSGVTLIELLIAVSLVSLLSLGILMALRVGINAMERVDSRFISNRRAIGVQKILESEIAGIVPVKAKCRPGGGPPGAEFSMFEGLPDQMRFVSTYSLSEGSRGFPRLLEFKVIRSDRDRGFRLIVDERIYGGPFMIGSLCAGFIPTPTGTMPRFQDIEIGPASFVLADHLAYCRILYRQTMPAPVLERWLPAWTIPDLLPSGIRVEMAPLAPDGGKLQPMTVSTAVHITKWVLGPYAD
jgi:prepilin-type N-terminal cleavage/methylation domain-containing protein